MSDQFFGWEVTYLLWLCIICRLGEIILPPRIVNELSWVANCWPSDIPSEDVQFVRPEVQRYCLMSAAGSYTDFHVDFGGSSVWYHVLRVWFTRHFCHLI